MKGMPLDLPTLRFMCCLGRSQWKIAKCFFMIYITDLSFEEEIIAVMVDS
jgi:hypothetical protein